MGAKRSVLEIRQFYDRWAPLVSTFCRLYMGEATTAEYVTAEAFLDYFRRELPLRLDHVPVALMSLALLQSVQRGGGEIEVYSRFELAVLGLAPEVRAVFILHGVLEVQLPWITAITATSYRDVCRLWGQALLDLQEYLDYVGDLRRFDSCGLAPKPRRDGNMRFEELLLTKKFAKA